MLPWLIGAAIVGLVVVACWDEIVSWLKDFIPKVKAAFQELKKNILHACAVCHSGGRGPDGRQRA